MMNHESFKVLRRRFPSCASAVRQCNVHARAERRRVEFIDQGLCPREALSRSRNCSRRGTKAKTVLRTVFVRGVTKIGSGRTELRSYASRPYFRKGTLPNQSYALPQPATKHSREAEIVRDEAEGRAGADGVLGVRRSARPTDNEVSKKGIPKDAFFAVGQFMPARAREAEIVRDEAHREAEAKA